MKERGRGQRAWLPITVQLSSPLIIPSPNLIAKVVKINVFYAT